MDDRHDALDRDIRDLWQRGRWWELFGFSSGDFTTLELAKQYSLLTKAYHDNPEATQIIDEAFATLNAPLTRQFYEGCRMVMRRIGGQMGSAAFRDAEHRMWLDLWRWVSERWEEPSEDLIRAIENRHRVPSGTEAIQLPQSWSDGGLKTAGLDSVMAASAFAEETTCQGCGRFDHTLRLAAFPYVISILIVSFRKASEAGVFCYQCRCAKSIKWAIVSLLFGWWSIWGFFWNIGALVDNYRGGKMLREYNDPLVARLAWAHMALGKIAEAKAALTDLSKHSFNKEALQLKSELDSRYPEVAPARTGVFRPGYLSLVLGVLAVFVIAGFAMFGGSSPPQTYVLTTSVSPPSAGSVSPSGGEYKPRAQVLLTASPASGYTFDRWSGSTSVTVPTILITMNSDKTLTAHFKATQTASGVLFSDDFSDEGSGWITYEGFDGRASYHDGCLHVTAYTAFLGTTCSRPQRYFADLILEVETRLVDGTDDNWHLVLCRYQDEDNNYAFGISADGYYLICRWVDGELTVLAGPTYSTHINQGWGVANLIRVECIGDSLSLSANGQLLEAVTDDTLSNGDIGLGALALAGTFTEVAFDRIVVSTP